MYQVNVRLPTKRPVPEGTRVSVGGVDYGRRLFFQAETAKHIVLYAKGGGVYMDRGSGTRYAPSQFIVLEKLREQPYTANERLVECRELLEISARGKTTVALKGERS